MTIAASPENPPTDEAAGSRGLAGPRSAPGVYLDYAATAAVRPEEIADAVAAYIRDVGATPGRAAHRRSLDAGRMVLRCRRALAELLGVVGDPARITFQLNATHALNVALAGTLRSGDAVLRTTLDHNAIRRPVAALARSRAVEQRVLTVSVDGGYDRAELEEKVEGVRLVVLPHASNVTGAVLPVRDIAEAAHAAGALVLLDAAQTAGHHPTDVEVLAVDMLAFTGHKGLLGPQGTGGLWVREGVHVEPLLSGGTGGDSDAEEMPLAYPDRLEAGSQNAPGLAGLEAAVRWLLETGPETIAQREMYLKERLVRGLRAISGLEIRSAASGLAIVSFRLTGMDPGEMAGVLDRRFGIQGRAGLHCAPDAHRVMGTLETGAYRLSIGWATTERDIDTAVSAVRAVAEGKGRT